MTAHRLITYLRVLWRRATRKPYRVPLSDPMHAVAMAFGEQALVGYTAARLKQRLANRDLLANLNWALRNGKWPRVIRTHRRRAVRVIAKPSVYERENPHYERMSKLFRGCGKPAPRMIRVGETEFRADYLPRAEQLAAKRKTRAVA